MSRLELTNEIRDPIAGLITLTDQETRILDTPAFQRLRRIRQLALADLVYPGCVHTRFQHSLGTLAIADRIWQRLEERDLGSLKTAHADRTSIRLAALLHDIGHGPFSHVSEQLLERHHRVPDLPAGRNPETIHEMITVDLLKHDHELRFVLTDEQTEFIVSVIAKQGPRSFYRDIITSDLDADKMDYLARDAHFAGVRYGQFDLEKIIESCTILEYPHESYLAIDEGGRFAVEQLILAKWHMNQQVYAHRIRIITDAMVVRGLELAIRHGDGAIADLYAYDGTDSALDRYLSFDDGEVVSVILKGGELKSKEVFERLRERRLYKELVMLPLGETHVPDPVIRTALISLAKDSDRWREWAVQTEEKVAELVGCEPWEAIVEQRSIRNPLYQEIANPEEIYVTASGRYTRTLGEYDDMVSGKLPADLRIYVIAPADNMHRGSTEFTEIERMVIRLLFQLPGGRS